MKFANINGIKTFSPDNEKSLINYCLNNKKIMIAINAEKILNANDRLKNIINNNIGYPDGIGAVICLKRNGFNKAFKIPGCQLWLKLIEYSYLF